MLICALDIAASLGRISAETETKRFEDARRSRLYAHEREMVDLAVRKRGEPIKHVRTAAEYMDWGW